METHADARFAFNFAGTDTLTAQIEQGAPADVFAGASSKYCDELSQEGLVDTPRAFATNRLVAIVPPSNPAGITSLTDLAKPGVKLVIGDSTVPIGAYTRQMLADLDATYGAGYSEDVLENVVSNALQVTAVVSSVELGEADAGIVYVTDVAKAGSKVARIEIPAAAQVAATYPIAVVKDSRTGVLAAQFVAYVLGPDAQALLRQAGFGPPPK
jgi:molybdate transport system substrate-binding protein